VGDAHGHLLGADRRARFTKVVPSFYTLLLLLLLVAAPVNCPH
jgi:hypothetical protein